MSPHLSLLNAGCYAAGFIGGFLFLVAPISERGRNAAHWIRLALWLSGAACVLWSVLGGVVLWGEGSIPSSALIVARQMKTVFSGMGGGIIVLLFASGEFLPAFASRTKDVSKR